MSASSNLIAVLDYGMGNLHSVSKALEHVAPNARVAVTDDVSIARQADRIVFPGVGAIRDCMAEINSRGFGDVIRQALPEKPVLGICVGMQALMDFSEENNGVDCLGILPGRVRFFGHNHRDASGQSLKVPHMGWNSVHQCGEHPLWENIAQDSRFYFVHSYYIDQGSIDMHSVDESSDHQHGEWLAATCDYGVKFAAALSLGNLFAVQFHPEKSHDAGLQLLKNFTQWQGV